jgi:hypothetical protein
MSQETPQTIFKRRAQLALGFALIFAVAIVETVNADRIAPNAASPYVWTALGAAAAVCLTYAVYCWRRARAE